FFGVADCRREIKPLIINIRRMLGRCNIGFGNSLEPHRLPNSGDRCIPYSFWIFNLFAYWLRSFISWVPNSHRDLLSAFFNIIRNVKSERVKPTLMFADRPLVNKYFRLPIDRSEMK